MAGPTLTQRYQGLKDPGVLLYYAIYCTSDFKKLCLITFLTCGDSLHNHIPLESYTASLALSFYNLYEMKLSPASGYMSQVLIDLFLLFAGPPDPNVPLQGSAALVPSLVAAASGMCLELGPGSGSLMRHFARNNAVATIYGAEPTVGLHDSLHANARREGVEDRYRVINASAERKSLIPGLAKEGLLQDAVGTSQGVFDTIICIRVLCSVTNLVDTVDGVYDLLKPGGKLVVCEHVVNRWQGKGNMLGRLFQLTYQLLGWTYFVGGCHMNRDIGKVLVEVARKDGGWQQKGLDYYFEWSALPYVAGVLVKR